MATPAARMEADYVGAKESLDEPAARGQGEEDLGIGEGNVKKEADARGRESLPQ
jgi:hypothetical protein